MSRITDEELEEVKETLDYIGLDLNNIPSFLKEFSGLDFRPARTYVEGTHKVYKYISVKDIEILLTPKNRLNTLQERYAEAKHINSYLEPQTEEDLVRFATFVRMLKTVNLDEVDKLQELQDNLNNKIPFKVKYNLNYLWQIYYSETEDKYFMLVPTEDSDYASVFYLIKKQIEYHTNGIDQKIFVPICNLDYSRDYLTKSEMTDLEKYVWFFTKEWPMIYEVYDKNDNLSVQIVGETLVYEKIKSYYKVELDNKEEATKFYKLIKGLFILQTELPHDYSFEVLINKIGGLEFYYNSKEINYNSLTDFIKNEVLNTCREIEELKKEKPQNDKELKALKLIANAKEKEYINKERQIATYLAYRKSFLGKVKYFFAMKKIKAKINEEQDVQEENDVDEIQEHIIINTIDMNKEFFTIDDLLKIAKEKDKLLTEVKNSRFDIEALKKKIDTLTVKTQNAVQYITEIENHRKSIFDFWRFTNKDKALALAAGTVQEEASVNEPLEKVFDYEDDIEDLGVTIDRLQRKILEKNDCDSVFLATTELLKDINSIKENGANVNLEASLQNLKAEAEKEKTLFAAEDFDVFGTISDDNTKVKVLGNKKHRESKKDKIQILDINKNTTEENYKNNLINVAGRIKKALSKTAISNNMSLYMASDSEIDRQGFSVFNINPQNAIDNLGKKDRINVYRVNLRHGVPAIYFSNIIYYDNTNKTLPLGLNISDKVLVDMQDFNVIPKNQKLFRINQDVDEFTSKTEIVCLHDYDLIKK